MAKSILEVKGIGPSAAGLLAEHGIKTADDLAASNVAAVSAINGFGEIRAAQVIADARALFGGGRIGPRKRRKKSRE